MGYITVNEVFTIRIEPGVKYLNSTLTSSLINYAISANHWASLSFLSEKQEKSWLFLLSYKMGDARKSLAGT